MKCIMLLVLMTCAQAATFAAEDVSDIEKDPKLQRVLDEFEEFVEKGDALVAEAETKRVSFKKVFMKRVKTSNH